jgi:hypothetical protein
MESVGGGDGKGDMNRGRRVRSSKEEWRDERRLRRWERRGKDTWYLLRWGRERSWRRLSRKKGEKWVKERELLRDAYSDRRRVSHEREGESTPDHLSHALSQAKGVVRRDQEVGFLWEEFWIFSVIWEGGGRGEGELLLSREQREIGAVRETMVPREKGLWLHILKRHEVMRNWKMLCNWKDKISEGVWWSGPESFVDRGAEWSRGEIEIGGVLKRGLNPWASDRDWKEKNWGGSRWCSHKTRGRRGEVKGAQKVSIEFDESGVERWIGLLWGRRQQVRLCCDKNLILCWHVAMSIEREMFVIDLSAIVTKVRGVGRQLLWIVNILLTKRKNDTTEDF